jgi:hypothetical protein
MNQILTLTRKDLQLLYLDKTSIVVTFALPIVFVVVFGGAFSKTFPPSTGITSYDYIFSKVMFWGLIGGVASSVASIAIENGHNQLRLYIFQGDVLGSHRRRGFFRSLYCYRKKLGHPCASPGVAYQ